MSVSSGVSYLRNLGTSQFNEVCKSITGKLFTRHNKTLRGLLYGTLPTEEKYYCR